MFKQAGIPDVAFVGDQRVLGSAPANAYSDQGQSLSLPMSPDDASSAMMTNLLKAFH
jgi:hypothetical protein